MYDDTAEAGPDRRSLRGLGRLRRWARRLTASEAELDAEALHRQTSRAGCTAADRARRGDLVTIGGRLRTVVFTPHTTRPTLEADLFDGTGVVTLVWLGQRRITGIEPGRTLTAHGRLALRGGRKVIYNPSYDIDL